MTTTSNRYQVSIEADPDLPIIRMTRDFDATPAELMRAHTDPELFARWVGPDGMDTEIVTWDATQGGRWRYVSRRDGMEFAFHGCFHDVGDAHIVQTFTFDGQPDDVALETLRFEDLGDGRTRLHAQSLVDSFESRDQWLASDMETGVDQGYAKLDALLGGAPMSHQVSIEADPALPIIRMTRDFDATPAELMRAHTDPDLFARWVGPNGTKIEIVSWDATQGGRWRYKGWLDGVEFAFHGCFHEVGDAHFVQTFTFDGQPDDVALETFRFEDLGDGRTRLHAQSLVDSFESRDQWLASGMETGVDDGYAKLDALVSELR